MDLFDQIQEARQFIETRIGDFAGSTGIILGTGLSGLADHIIDPIRIPYSEIPHFPQSTVESHRSELFCGHLSGKPVFALAGRFHYYEGYSMKQVTFPVRVLYALGVNQIIISNVSGSVNAEMAAGDLVFVKDHINLHPENPLRGPNDERLGPRFPDMLNTYNREWIDFAVNYSKEEGFRPHEGVYVALQGPNLETPAEYEFMHRIGADLVGMSTVPEVIVAKHAGMSVFVCSIVSNACYPIEAITETTVEEVIEVGKKATPKLEKVVQALIAKFG